MPKKGKERWKPVVGYEGIYEVSDRGRLKSLQRVIMDGRLRRERFLEGSPSNGRILVNLSRDGTVEVKLLYRLVLEAFVGLCPSGMDACHFPDPDPKNNNLSNLRWGTPKENAKDRDKHGRTARGESHGCAKLTESDVRRIRKLVEKSGLTYKQIGERFGVTTTPIFFIAKRKTWKHV